MPICDLTAKRGVRIYHEFHGPFRKEYKGANEELVFVIIGSAADLRKVTDQQYIRQTEGYVKVLTYDHRNTGQSTIKDEPCTMADYADDAAALLEEVVPEKLPVKVMGISFGGMVAQHLAIRHPHLIKRLVLCCCTTGGEGGSPYPIENFYKPGVTVDERVTMRATLANTTRNEEWRRTHKSEWQMVYTLLRRDEDVGKSDPLRQEGLARQLEARSHHDTWDRIHELEMPVIACGSAADGISPIRLMENMVDRIGPNCEKRLDFGWGHAFVAADTDAMLFINEWLRRPMPKGWLPTPRPRAGVAASAPAATPAKAAASQTKAREAAPADAKTKAAPPAATEAKASAPVAKAKAKEEPAPAVEKAKASPAAAKAKPAPAAVEKKADVVEKLPEEAADDEREGGEDLFDFDALDDLDKY